MARDSAVPTVVLAPGKSIYLSSGALTFLDLVPTPPRHLLPGFGAAQVLVQCQNAAGDVIELTVPELAALVQTEIAGAGTPSRQSLTPTESWFGVSPVRRLQLEQLAGVLKHYDQGDEVLGVTRPPKGCDRKTSLRRLSSELKKQGHSGVGYSTLYTKLALLRDSGWDAAALLTAEDKCGFVLDPLLKESEQLRKDAKECFDSEHRDLVKPSIPDLVQVFESWLRRQGTSREQEGYSKAACRRVMAEFARRARLGAPVATVESKAARKHGAQGRFTATMPYESLQIDAWTVDCLAIDQYGRTIRLFLLAAIDTVTRKLRALRFLPGEPSMQDVRLLIFDTVKGAPIWPVGEPLCPRLPSAVELTDSLTAYLTREDASFEPVGMIHVDNGSAMIGKEAIGGALTTGIHVQPARPGMGADKPHIEAWFSTLAAFVKFLPGATGSKPADRPRGRRQGQLLSVVLVELFIRMWTECVYHVRPHSGLLDPTMPGLHLSPNEVETLLLHNQGVIEVGTHPFAAVHLLDPVDDGGTRVMHDEGIRNRHRDYDIKDDAQTTQRMKDYSQGAPTAGLRPRPLSVLEHRYDADAVIARHPDGDFVVLPERDLARPSAPLADDFARGLRHKLWNLATDSADGRRPDHKVLTEAIIDAAWGLTAPVQPSSKRRQQAQQTDADVLHQVLLEFD